MNRKGLRISVCVVAVLASAFFFMIHVANGVVYGSLLGLNSRQHDLQIASLRSRMALTLALGLQVVAILTIMSSLTRRIEPSDALERWVIRFWHLALSVVVSGLGTALIFGLILKLARTFQY